MLKNLLIAAAILLLSPAFVFADDIFFAFGSGSSATSTSTATTADGSGSVFIYSDGDYAFDAADLVFTNSDKSVIEFTGGEVFNPEFETVGGTRFDEPVQMIFDSADPAAAGRLLVVGILENGVNPALGKLFDPGYDDEVGANGAFLLARVDYDIVGAGTANLDFDFGPNGVLEVPDVVLTPTFRSGMLTVSATAIPEPSSLALLMLGSFAMVTRRRRA